jgi:signal transducing adaptor molecule
MILLILILYYKHFSLSTQKLKQCLKKWAEGDFKTDPQLNLIPSLYQNLKSKGHDFSDPHTIVKREPVLSKDPNVVSSQQEEDDIAKAIELSLKEKSSPKATSSLYPSVSSAMSATPAPEPRKVRALYDFEAAEDNELTFKAGEIIMVLEDSDPNWWKGQNHRSEGLFPSNFVTADLSVEPENLDHKNSMNSGSNKKSVQFSDDQQNAEQKDSTVPEINEDSIDRLLFLLHEADPEDPSQDSPEMLRLESIVNQMGPLIDSELERVDRKHAQLTQLSGDLVEAINLYHSLMRDSDRVMSAGSFMNYPGAQQPPVGYPGAPMSMYGNIYGTMQPPPNMMGMSGMNFPPSSLPNYIPPSSAPPFIPTSGFPPQPQQQMPPQQPNLQQNQQMPNGNLPNDQNPEQFQGMSQNVQQIPQMGAPQQIYPGAPANMMAMQGRFTF